MGRVRIRCASLGRGVKDMVDCETQGAVFCQGGTVVGWIQQFEDDLVISLAYRPWAIVQSRSGDIWIYGGEVVAGVDGQVLWHRADATELDAGPVAVGEEAQNA